jgi:hypothetical protein
LASSFLRWHFKYLSPPLHQPPKPKKFHYNHESEVILNTTLKTIPWIFIPLPSNSVYAIRAWIHRLASSKNEDSELARKCEEIIQQAFLTYKLRYNSDKYGEIHMSELRLLHYSDGICVPEHCFIDPPATLERVQEPLRPFFRDL